MISTENKHNYFCQGANLKAMQARQESREQLKKKIKRLHQELLDLRREKADLEILLETTIAHADTVEALLQESNQQLQAEVTDRLRAEAALQESQAELQSLLAIATRDKADLEIILETTTEHSIIIEDLLHNKSIRDPLTNLFNRGYIDKSLAGELRRVRLMSQPLGIIISDIDHFKCVNDTFGHQAGDVVLQEVSQILLGNIRNSDIACRYGGEEFMLILPEASLKDTAAKAEQLRQGVKRLNIKYLDSFLGSASTLAEHRITISLGVASFPEHGKTSAELIQAADKALYCAKALGRDRVSVASTKNIISI